MNIYRKTKVFDDGKIGALKAITLEVDYLGFVEIDQSSTGEFQVVRWLDENTPEMTATEIESLRVKWTDIYKMTQLRQVRDAKLADSDWRVLPDRPAPSQDIIDYRQALRDVPDNTTPSDIVLSESGEIIDFPWPMEPNG